MTVTMFKALGSLKMEIRFPSLILLMMAHRLTFVSLIGRNNQTASMNDKTRQTIITPAYSGYYHGSGAAAYHVAVRPFFTLKMTFFISVKHKTRLTLLQCNTVLLQCNTALWPCNTALQTCNTTSGQ